MRLGITLRCDFCAGGLRVPSLLTGPSYARRHGWVRIAGRDYCPGCVLLALVGAITLWAAT